MRRTWALYQLCVPITSSVLIQRFSKKVENHAHAVALYNGGLPGVRNLPQDRLQNLAAASPVGTPWMWTLAYG
jgi:hypothetical protein